MNFLSLTFLRDWKEEVFSSFTLRAHFLSEGDGLPFVVRIVVPALRLWLLLDMFVWNNSIGNRRSNEETG